jgi:hypothetical protein
MSEWLRTYSTTIGLRCWKNGSPRLKNESGWLQRKIDLRSPVDDSKISK